MTTDEYTYPYICFFLAFVVRFLPQTDDATS